MHDSTVEQRAKLYVERREAAIEKELGFGNDGKVFLTTRKHAIKIFSREETFRTELECYRRLEGKQITKVCGFAVPRLIDADESLFVIEMTVVTAPYLLDFGKAYLDSPPQHFSQEVMDDWCREQAERWEDFWPVIKKVLSSLQRLGIFYMDPKPGNILPENWNPNV